jgi:hypothetical protein
MKSVDQPLVEQLQMAHRPAAVAGLDREPTPVRAPLGSGSRRGEQMVVRKPTSSGGS